MSRCVTHGCSEPVVGIVGTVPAEWFIIPLVELGPTTTATGVPAGGPAHPLRILLSELLQDPGVIIAVA